MKVLVTGAKGFLGKNLVENLKNIRDGKSRKYSPMPELEIMEFDINNTPEDLEKFCNEADFVFHLAGVNRPQTKEEFYSGNRDLTVKVIDLISKAKKPPLMISSTIWASGDTDYGKSKRYAEEAVEEYGRTTGAKTLIYRFTNLFGKWSRPSYNTVVATFCYNVARDIEIKINDENAQVTLCYADDVVYELIDGLLGKEHRKDGFCFVEKNYTVTLGKLASLIRSFKAKNKTPYFPDCDDEFAKKLFATYTSFVPTEDMSFNPKTNSDNRGSFTELFKMAHGEQVSLNVVKEGQKKGNHWHNTKIERFTIIRGEGVIKLRKIGDSEVFSYYCKQGEILNVDIPAGYTHNIENTGKGDLEFIIWCNEEFDLSNPDTFFEEV